MLSRLRPTALVPGQTELIPGVADFLAQARFARLPYVATNWATEHPGDALPKSLISDVELTSSVVLRVAFLGIVDPNLERRVAHLKTDGIRIGEPIQAVHDELDRLARDAHPPDVVIILTSAGPEVVDKIRRVPGIDLGDANSAEDRTTQTTIHLKADNDDHRPVAALLPLRAIGSAKLTLSHDQTRWALTTIDSSFLETREDLLPDPRVTAVLPQVRAAAYPRLEKIRLQKKPGGPLAALTDDEWQHVVCECVRKYTSADVVFLPDLPSIERLPGAISGIVLAQRLAVIDQLAVDAVGGTIWPASSINLRRASVPPAEASWERQGTKLGDVRFRALGPIGSPPPIGRSSSAWASAWPRSTRRDYSSRARSSDW